MQMGKLGINKRNRSVPKNTTKKKEENPKKEKHEKEKPKKRINKMVYTKNLHTKNESTKINWARAAENKREQRASINKRTSERTTTTAQQPQSDCSLTLFCWGRHVCEKRSEYLMSTKKVEDKKTSTHKHKWKKKPPPNEWERA